ncbi:hypothetical protein [Thioalkalivibrio sp. ALE19]|uniref:hypothetical protein n=1 Tax=Thioalkalivibrio sp. ALE19 TaxID=1266909 RepID=UPI00049065EB|nr:hypothetical protein [Thioalkalivibrio sp. ALE19]
MGHWEQESGTIKLPKTEFTKVRRAVVQAHNEYVDRMLRLAQSIHTRMGEKPTPQIPEDFRTPGWTGYERLVIYMAMKVLGSDHVEEAGKIKSLMGWYTDAKGLPNPNRKPRKPTRKALDNDPRMAPIGLREANPRIHLAEDASIEFDAEQRTVTWDVRQGRHVIEKARRHPVGKALFDALKRVKWTRESGGEILYQDEYGNEADAAPQVRKIFGKHAESMEGQLRQFGGRIYGF